MKTVILCGGRGTRIQNVTGDLIPKPMLQIGKYPVLWHIMNLYAYYGHKDFILCLGYLGWQIKSYFLNFKPMINNFTIQLNQPEKLKYLDQEFLNFDWNISLVETGENTQTGARIFKIRQYVENDNAFMLTYGDGLSNVDINDLISFHTSHGKIGTVTGVRPSGRFGEIEVSIDNQVFEFNEKPQVTAGRINGGFFVFDAKRIWKYLSEGDDLIFEQEPLRELVKDRELMMYPHDGFWQPMDTHREYQVLNEMWNESIQKGNAPWPGEKLLKNNI